jgi:hypothetical protein
VTVTLLPDIERMVSNYLRANADVIALVGSRVYTVSPKDPTGKFPFVRLTRVSGTPLFSAPLKYDQARIQVDCWGGSKQLAWQTAATIMAVLAAGFVGDHAEGTVVGVDIGTLQDLPDTTFDPPQPRWLFDAVITARSL